MGHYLTCVATPFDGDTSFIINKLFNRLHGVFVHHGFNLGLGFPQWSAANPGATITVFGSVSQLALVKENSGIVDLTAKGMLRLDPVQKVPEGASQVAFVRDRSQEPVSPSALRRKAKRLKKHAESKGESWDEAAFWTAHSPAAPQRKAKKLPFVVVERSSGNFRLYFKQVSSLFGDEEPGTGFSEYGLSRGEAPPTWVHQV